MLALCIVLAGCNRSLPRKAFVEAYETEAASETLAGDFKVTVLPLTPEYLAARVMDSTLAPEKLHSETDAYRKAHYVSMQITLRHPTGGPDDVQKDLLNGALSRGEAEFRKRLHFLENQVSAYASLQCGGDGIKPVSYRFQRGYGFPAIHNFLFLFPKENKGQLVELRRCRFSLKEIGLGSGTLEFPLRSNSRLALKL